MESNVPRIRLADGLGVMVVAAGLLLAGLAGCDGRAGAGGGTMARYPDVWMEMRLPPKWSQDASGIHSERDHRDDHHGLVYVEDFRADTLENHVSIIVDAERLEVVSRDAFEFNGHEAIELITEGAYRVYEAYILRDREVVVVSFRTLPEAFDEQVDAFRAAVRSIRFQ